ncbi:ABC transporter permease [Methanohalophilus halophilus]|uniref:ABC transporter permease n=1 Tax=Methanohalophilus halophilus TaxID=2177 RepID=A0A1L3Q4A2_9EURY|nr:ABC transporter permease [Methanohalophilus halophilus]APH39675.1 ABC transporter permease [Methanohalophilus halophilus]RNI08991.1 ABC transporter permease [Methanohalophilus halophilus]SDW35415.1 putative ABC transport system permease protein [Methanohalophilus halophilus]
MVNPKQAFKIALGSIRSAKLRSLLTTLGIVIGVAAVIANVSLGASFNQFFTDEIGAVGSNFIIVESKEPGTLGKEEMSLISNLQEVDGISPINSQTATVSYQSSRRHIGIMGVTEDYTEVANLRLAEGNFLTDKDSYAAVIGSEVAEEIFDRPVGNKNSIDLTFTKNNGESITHRFVVKGILQSPDTQLVQSGIEPDNRIFIPISTMNSMLEENHYNSFFIKAKSMEVVEQTSEEIDEKLGRQFGIDSRQMDNDNAKPYFIMDQVEILEQTKQLSDSLGALLTAVALISLVVGSIGIMNIMLVTVTERTQEIGLMKSLGYTNTSILNLFIVEAMIVGLFGGIAGTLMGMAGAYIAESYMGLPVAFPLSKIAAGFIISVFVGLVAGVYPANKAAKMNPTDALRNE